MEWMRSRGTIYANARRRSTLASAVEDIDIDMVGHKCEVEHARELGGGVCFEAAREWGGGGG